MFLKYVCYTNEPISAAHIHDEVSQKSPKLIHPCWAFELMKMTFNLLISGYKCLSQEDSVSQHSC